MKAICVGEMLIDFTPGKEPYSFVANPGGAPANVAVSISRNGGEVGFLGKLGDDDFGRRLKTVLQDDKIAVLCPELTKEAVTTLAFVSLDETGDRSFTFARKPGADLLLNQADVESVDFSNYDLVHAGSVSQTMDPEREAVLLALKKGKENGCLVSFDINYRDAFWSLAECKEQVDRVLPMVDFLKISEEELYFCNGEEGIPKMMEEYGILVVVETLGADGSRIFFHGQTEVVKARAAKAVDTTGAGDSFWGGFLFRLLDQGVRTREDVTMEKLVKAAEYGSIASGICVERPGGIPAIPYAEEIQKYYN